MTSPAKQAREILAKGPLPFRKLHEIIGGDDAVLWKAVYQMQYRGFVKISGEDKTITLLKSGGGARRTQRQEARREKSREASL